MDTAQLAGAAETDPNVAIADAANAFKIATSPPAPRDELGQFAAKAQPEPILGDEPEPQAADDSEIAQDEGEEEDDAEAAPEAQPMPPSWPVDQAEQWNELPPDTQAFLAKREGEREAAVQAKFQESANARKAAEAAQAEAVANRAQYAQAIELVASALYAPEPDPRAFGAGTGQYDREGYDLALAQHRESQRAVTQLAEQYQAVKAQEAAEAQALAEQQAQAHAEWMNSVETHFRPKLLADVPELTDQIKAPAKVQELIQYAKAQGYGEHLFTEENLKTVTSPEIHVLWKAQQYDRLREAKAAPKPLPASPAVKPGVSSPRSAQKNAQRQKAFDRLVRDGSVEAGAAVFKSFLR